VGIGRDDQILGAGRAGV